MMQVLQEPQQLQQWALQKRAEGQCVGLVPTMGYLHEGHLQLLRTARQECDVVVLSIYVNPTQFGPGEDLESYPRNWQRDQKLAADAGVDVVFYPRDASMYPPGYATYVEVEGLTEGLCGAGRPGHFRGVTTVVSKLFMLSLPHKAYFGRKDYQQLTVIRRMARDLHLPVEVVGLPTVRESDGLALSSRNSYLTPDQRQQALALVDSLRRVRQAALGGQTEPQALRAVVRARLEHEPDLKWEYIELVDADTLEPVAAAGDNTVVLIAARLGHARLIDNNPLLQEV